MLKYWLILGVCIVLETVATTMLKLSEGFTKPLYAIIAMLTFCVILAL